MFPVSCDICDDGIEIDISWLHVMCYFSQRIFNLVALAQMGKDIF